MIINRQAFSTSIFIQPFAVMAAAATAHYISKPWVKSRVPTTSNALDIRLNEIKSVTKSLLTIQQRMELRQDLHLGQNQLKESGTGNGIWLSIASLLLVIALIIILL